MRHDLETNHPAIVALLDALGLAAGCVALLLLWVVL